MLCERVVQPLKHHASLHHSDSRNFVYVDDIVHVGGGENDLVKHGHCKARSFSTHVRYARIYTSVPQLTGAGNHAIMEARTTATDEASVAPLRNDCKAPLVAVREDSADLRRCLWL